MTSLREMLIAIQDRFNEQVDWNELADRYSHIKNRSSMVLEIREKNYGNVPVASGKFFMELDLEAGQLNIVNRVQQSKTMVHVWMTEELAWAVILGRVAPMSAWIAYPDQCGITTSDGKPMYHAEALDVVWKALRGLVAA